MAVHDKFRAVAKKLIDKHGREVTLVKSSTTEAQTGKPWRGSDAPASGGSDPGQTEVTATAAFVRVIERDDEQLLLVKRGSMAMMVAASDLVSEQDVSQFEAVRDGTTIWRIVSANVIDPGNQIIAYSFEVEQ